LSEKLKVRLINDTLEVGPPILADPARGHCYPGPTKPCESWGESPRRPAP